MKTEDAWDELVKLKNSWKEQGLKSSTAVLLLTSMICRFAIANNINLQELQDDIKELINILYNDLKEHETKIPLSDVLSEIHLPDKMVN